MRRSILSRLMLAFTVLVLCRPAVVAQTADADMSMLRRALEPHGRWLEHPRFGAVFIPRVDQGWRPFTNGRWLLAREGWYWHAQEPYGWAVFHYGRWFHDSGAGWAWIPGDVWSPAAVEWRVPRDDAGILRIGWAPLPAVGLAEDADTARWVFTPIRAFTAPDVSQRIIPTDRNRPLLQRTRSVEGTGRSPTAGAVVGPDPSMFEQLVRRPMPRVRLVSASQPPVAAPPAARGAAPETVSVYRPRLVLGGPTSVQSQNTIVPLPPPTGRPDRSEQPRTFTDRHIERGGTGPVVPHRTPADAGPAPRTEPPPRPRPLPRARPQQPNAATAPTTGAPPASQPVAAPSVPREPARPAALPSRDAVIQAPPSVQPQAATKSAPTTAVKETAKAPPTSSTPTTEAAAPAPTGGTPVQPIIVNPGASGR